MASELPLPVTRPWTEGMSVSLENLRPADVAAVRRQLPIGLLHYVGSDQGCGCGFMAELDESTGKPVRRQFSPSRVALKRFLVEHLPPGQVIQLFSCWDGDQALAVEHEERLTSHGLVTSAWRYREHERLEVVMTG